MHPAFQRANGLTGTIISAAIEVHRDKGSGLIESIYQWCLEKELELRELAFLSQKTVTVTYKGFSREERLRLDVLVEDCVLVEAKSVEQTEETEKFLGKAAMSRSKTHLPSVTSVASCAKIWGLSSCCLWLNPSNLWIHANRYRHFQG